MSICDEYHMYLTKVFSNRYTILEGVFTAQVRPVAEDEMFKVLRTGKRKKKQWKRMVTKVTYVGQSFTRKPPKYERFIRPTGITPKHSA